MKTSILLISIAFASCTSHAQQQTYVDSVFSAIQTAVDIKSKTLPDGFHNQELYRLLLEDEMEKHAAQITAAIAMRDTSADTARTMEVMKLFMVRNNIHRAKIVSWTPELLQNATAPELKEAAKIVAHRPVGHDTTELWCAYLLSSAALKRGDTSATDIAVHALREYFDAHGSRIQPDSAMKSIGFEADTTSKNNSASDQNVNWLKSYSDALQKARANKKNILIYFTGHMVTNCREMEQNILSRDDIKELMKQFVCVGLFTDRGTDEENNNAAMEEKRFDMLALPFFALMSPNDRPLATFPTWTRDAEAFKAFLQLKKKYLWKK